MVSPPSPSFPGRRKFTLISLQNQPTACIRIANPFSGGGGGGGGRDNCLTSAARVILESGTTFLHINALARLTDNSRRGEGHVMPKVLI